MMQRKYSRHDLSQSERDPGSLALYAWAGIAALSALTACITVLFPVDVPTHIAKKPGFAVGEPVIVGTKPNVTTSKDVSRPVVEAKKPVEDLAQKTVELLEKYGETIESVEPVDTVTAASAAKNVEEVSVEAAQPTQSVPSDHARGATIGLSDSIPALAKRYAALQRRAPDLFETVEPLVELVEGSAGLEARLVAGPFSQEAQLAEFCRAIKLRMTIDCLLGDYSGDPLAQ